MQNIDIKYLKEIKEELEELQEDDAIFVDDNNDTKYVILPIETYDLLESYRSILEGDKQESLNPNVKIISNAINELSYDEYETIKKQLMEVFEKTFKPKPEKLN